MKILHSYLRKEGEKKVHKAIQGEPGEADEVCISTESPGPEIRIVYTKLKAPTFAR